MTSLAVKYRPQEWEDVVEQKSVVQILKQQIATNNIKNAYLFAGASGAGKTTASRILANKINKGVGSPIEIDAASNSGVDNVRSIIADAQERAIDSEYKIYIIDEAHALSNQAWQAFLKCIEEPPQYTIFIFCTTDPQKIPATILNRVQRFNISRISTNGIKNRLAYICEQEHFINYEESIDYISKIADGGMRDAIALLEKCASLSTNLDINTTLSALGNYSYSSFFDLINSMIDGNEKQVLSIIDTYYNDGNDLKLFVDQYLNFCIDVTKYALFKSCDLIRIPISMKDKLDNTVNIEGANKYFQYIINKLLELKINIKNDTNIQATIEVIFLQLTRCQ